MSSFDELLTTVSDDVRKAIESVCDKAGTFDADWCILKSAGELIATPRLPRVSPDDMVEGEWYVVKDGSGETHIARCLVDADEWPVLYAFDVCFEYGLNIKDVEIWGPISFELEGD